MKKLTNIVIAIAFLAVASMAYAAQTVDVNVTSEPIAEGSTCGKAGGITLSFDNNTVFTEGDKLTFDLDLDTTLCKDINLIIGLYKEGEDGPITANTITEGHMPTVGPITSTNPDLNVLNFYPDGDTSGEPSEEDGGMYFRLKGSAGSARVTLTVIGTSDESDNETYKFSVGEGDTDDKFIIKFLDGADYSDEDSLQSWDQAAIFEITDGSDLDDWEYELADASANTLCINISETDSNYIDANFDSTDDIFTFVPSDPQIAHVVSATNYSLYEYKSRVTGNLLYPDTADQETCSEIDNEDGDGFCTTGDLHAYNDVILKSDSTFDLDGDVQVTFEILVNGESGENGVYWVNKTVYTDAAETYDDLGSAENGMDSDGAFLADGEEEVEDFDDETSDCEVEDDAKAVIIVASDTASDLGMDADNKYVYFNMPSMTIDSSEVSEGDIVSVKVTIEQLPCGSILEDTWEIGTFGCVASADAYAQRYPYFGTSTGSYANAIIITNVGDDDGTAELILYETDGDMATVSIDVAAHAMEVALLTSLDWTISEDSTGSGTLGDARSYVEASADFSMDGAAMITNATTGESIGYLPRQDAQDWTDLTDTIQYYLNKIK